MSIGPEQGHDWRDVPRRFKGVSGRTLNRRVVMKAAAGVAAIAAAGGIGTTTPGALAQDDGEWSTRSREWEPPQQRFSIAAVGSSSDWQAFDTEFPFFAIGASWDASVGLWPVIEIQLSEDGATWSETFKLTADNDGGGGPDVKAERLYTPLVHTYGSQHVRYRTVDIDGNPGEVAGLRFTYIDATDGPWEKDIQPAASTLMEIQTTQDDTRTPPEIITREQWGANEGYRFDDFGEIWPPEYEKVHHIIVHHTDTPNTQDIPTAIRSIYYYHAVTQGWGDIGYNYLVGRDGRIYQGRYGGQDVIGGHSYQYAVGSSGICIIGDFQNTPVPDAALAGLVAIVAWVGRDLDPYGTADFLQAPDLPVICSHRDVNATTCPGDYLYNDLPEIRDMVAATLDAGDLNTPFPGGIIPGDRVAVNTGDGSALNIRSSAGETASVVGQLDDGEFAMVTDGPVETGTGNWYEIEAEDGSVSGWATAEFLLVAPVPPPPFDEDDYPYGLNIFAASSVNVRSGPRLNEGVVATYSRGKLGFIMAGPITADGYEWYQVRWEGGTDGWSAKEFLSPAPFDDNPGGQFAIGDRAEATEYINIRARPGIAQTIIAALSAGGRMEITQGPVAVNDYIWYGVYTQNDDGGWVVENTLRAVGAPPAAKFAIGDGARVTESLRLRTSPSTSSSTIVVMPAGTVGEVVGGPETGSGYTWWQLKTSLGTGWAVQDWLTKTTAPEDPGTPPPTSGKFENGEGVRVTENLNMRSSASTSANVITVLPSGTTGTVVGGPQTGSGYTWWRIETSRGTGWVVQDWLVSTGTTEPEDPGTPPPTGKFKTGDAVRVTENLNMRSGASTTNGVIAVLPAGTTGTVKGGPQTGSGYTWWQIETSRGTGWVAENWLAASTTPTDPGTPPPTTGKFKAGDAVRVTESLNMRSGAGTTNGVVAVLPAGTTGTVVGGPQTASGYTWWRIETSRGTGWVAENWLAASGGSTPPASGKFETGDAVRVTESLNMRSGASTSSSVITVLPAGTTGTVVDGPQTGSGYTWWKIETSRGTGWVAENWLS